MGAGALLAVALVLAGCSGDDADPMADGDDDGMASFCEDEDRADAFAVDLRKTGERYAVTIVQATPAEPVRGDNIWMVRVTDTSGAPMEAMTVDAKPWMPDHGHGTPVEEQVTELGAGEYEVSVLNLFMAGLWRVTLDVTGADDETDSVEFFVCVD
jgi:YtkA-like